MQALRYASRRALRATVVMQEPCIASARACSSEAGGRVQARLNKEERYQLAKQFVEKFKAANNGQLPALSVLRKEVGGKYDVLKGVLQDFEKCPSEQVATQEGPEPAGSKKSSVQLEEMDAKCHEKVKEKSTAVAKDGRKKKSSEKEKESRQEGAATMQVQHDAEETTKTSAEKSVKPGRKKKSILKKEEDSLKDKSLTPEALKNLEDVKSVTQVDSKLSSKTTEKQKKSSVRTEATLDPLMDNLATDEDDDDDSNVATPECQSSMMQDNLATDEDDDDDSDVAAPEYRSPMMQMKEGLAQAVEKISKVGSVVHGEADDQSIKIEQRLKVQGLKDGIGPSKSLGQHSTVNKAPKQAFPDGSSGFGSKPTGHLSTTTVLRVVNLPAHISAHQLKSLCESVAKVHGVNLRRGRIADVQFNVDTSQMQGVLERLRKVSIGSTILKVFPTQRFSCDGGLKPQDAHQFRSVRNTLIHGLQQRLKFLRFQIQDYRELYDMKVAK